MKQHHFVIILVGSAAAFLAAFGTELATAHTWAEINSPAFVGKMLIELASAVGAIVAALKIDTTPRP